jgi:DNA-binding MarR family transcriptional regulator
VLSAAQQRPGSTTAELRVATGLVSSVVSRELKRLVKSGELKEHQLPDWKPTYTVPES